MFATINKLSRKRGGGHLENYIVKNELNAIFLRNQQNGKRSGNAKFNNKNEQINCLRNELKSLILAQDERWRRA